MPRVYVDRWVSLAAGILMASGAGTGYAFGLFSKLLKDNLSYTQEEVELIGTVGNFGLYLNVFAGLCLDKYGPRITGTLGAIMVAFGFTMMLLSVQKTIDSTYGSVAVYNFFAQHGSGWASSCATVTVVKNFGAYRGKSVGLAKSSFALSTSIVAQIYAALYAPDAESYLRFLAIYVPLLSLITLCFINEVPKSDQKHDLQYPPNFDIWYAIVLTTSVFVSVAGLVEHAYERALAVRIVGGCGVVLFFIAVITAAVNSSGKVLFRKHKESDSDSEKANVIAEVQCARAGDESLEALLKDADAAENRAAAAVIPDVPLHKAAQTLNFWLVFTSFGLGAGAGLTVINNVSQIAESLEGGEVDGKVYVTLIGAFNFMGRLLTGQLSDRYAHMFTRPQILCIALLMMGLSQIVMAFSDINVLYAGVIFTAFSYGGIFVMCATLAGDLFGLKHFGANYGALDFGPSLGSLTFATFIAGRIYDSHVTDDTSMSGDDSSDRTCYGRDCYFSTFFITCAASVLGSALAFVLSRRVKRG